MRTHQRTARYDAVETKSADGRNFEFALAQRQGRKGLMLQLPIGLVVSSDQVVGRKLAQVLRQCSVAPVVASTVAARGRRWPGKKFPSWSAMTTWTMANTRTS